MIVLSMRMCLLGVMRPVLPNEAIEFYINHPYEFITDILQVTLTDQQREIIEQIPKAIKQKKNISVKAGH